MTNGLQQSQAHNKSFLSVPFTWVLNNEHIPLAHLGDKTWQQRVPLWLIEEK